MAYRGNNPGDPNLPMGSRLKRLLVVAALFFALFASTAPLHAATDSPTSTISPMPTASPTPTVSPTASPKVSPTSTVKPTPKPTPKPTATKKVVKKSTKKKVRVTPSPAPIWPPKGFIVDRETREVYAKVPTSKELVGIISADKGLALQIKKCTDFICGAIQVASVTGCTWWEAKSNIFGGDGVKLGELTIAYAGTLPRQIKTIISTSPESAAKGGRAKFTSVICNREPRNTSIAAVQYQKVESVVAP